MNRITLVCLNLTLGGALLVHTLTQLSRANFRDSTPPPKS
jgi:hypothetical protein